MSDFLGVRDSDGFIFSWRQSSEVSIPLMAGMTFINSADITINGGNPITDPQDMVSGTLTGTGDDRTYVKLASKITKQNREILWNQARQDLVTTDPKNIANGDADWKKSVMYGLLESMTEDRWTDMEAAYI